MKDKMVLVVNVPARKVREELEMPANVTANELILALNQIYALQMDPDNIFGFSLKADNPKALLRGDRTLADYGLHDGTEIWV